MIFPAVGKCRFVLQMFYQLAGGSPRATATRVFDFHYDDFQKSAHLMPICYRHRFPGMVFAHQQRHIFFFCISAGHGLISDLRHAAGIAKRENAVRSLRKVARPQLVAHRQSIQRDAQHSHHDISAHQRRAPGIREPASNAGASRRSSSIKNRRSASLRMLR